MGKVRLIVALAAFNAMFTMCSVEIQTTGTDTSLVCTAGSIRSCNCPSGVPAQQTCVAGFWMACACDPGDIGGTDQWTSQDAFNPPTGAVFVWGLGAGGGVLTSPNYRLRLHIAQPPTSAIRQSSNYRLLLGQGP